ncbi:MAG: nuclease PIN [Arthrobacter sp.]|nr:nuclease PIN [Arthrobacter sp.]
MKLRLFPQEPTGLNLLSQMAHQIVLGTATFSEILGAPASEHVPLVEDMHNHEAKSAELHFALLTHMRTSFLNPLPREDMYALSRYLNEAMEKLDAAADLVLLYKLERPPKRAAEQLEIISRQAELTVDAMRQLNNLDDLEDYWIEVLRLTKRAERTHRVWVADMLKDMKSAQYARHRDVADQLVDVTRDMRRIATQVGSIIVKES